jgi:hypothetical protein
LLSHYWTGNEDARLRREQIHDWLDDLGAFASSIVASAVTEWRQTQSKRPSPADIRTICLRLEREAKEDRERHRPMPASRQIEAIPPSPDTVRDNWRSITFSGLSEAERDLYRASCAEATERARREIAMRAPRLETPDDGSVAEIAAQEIEHQRGLSGT